MGFGTPLSLVIGLILISGGLVLFFLGNFRPDLKRDSDNIYGVLGILAGILGVVSFNKDIVPSIEQLLLAGMCIFLMWENIQNRTPNPDANEVSPVMGGVTAIGLVAVSLTGPIAFPNTMNLPRHRAVMPDYVVNMKHPVMAGLPAMKSAACRAAMTVIVLAAIGRTAVHDLTMILAHRRPMTAMG
ncbi:MAG: hypothetical protein HC805_06780 [Alkalinema sp. RL_2_19]|nr:hypothetical protein [Alkalinema sp. RL_2_19]